MRISDWSSDVCSSDLSPSTHENGGVGSEAELRHFQVLGRGALTDAGGSVVGRPVAGAEIAAIFALVLALARAQRHAAQMGADAHGDQPLLLAVDGAFLQRVRIAQAGRIDIVGFGDFLDRKS